MTEESTTFPHTQLEFADLDDLKSQYSVLKRQRDTYKLLLSNYEKMFLQEGADIGSLRKENDILLRNCEKLCENSNNSPKSLKNLGEHEEFSQNSPENSPLNLDKQQRERNISLKIEKLNQEINAFKGILEEKNEILNIIGSENRVNSNEFVIKKHSLSIKNPQDNDTRKLSSRFSIENLLSCEKYNNFSINSEENLRNCEESNKSADSAYQMQVFFKDMAGKLQNLEENNENLSSLLQNGAKEKEEMQRKFEEMRKEIEKLSKIVEEQKKDNELLRIEKYLMETKKTRENKESICRNLCNLI